MPSFRVVPGVRPTDSTQPDGHLCSYLPLQGGLSLRQQCCSRHLPAQETRSRVGKPLVPHSPDLSCLLHVPTLHLYSGWLLPTTYSFVLPLTQAGPPSDNALMPWASVCLLALLALTWSESPGQMNVAIGARVPAPQSPFHPRLLPMSGTSSGSGSFYLGEDLVHGSQLMSRNWGRVVLSPRAAWGREEQQKTMPRLFPPL